MLKYIFIFLLNIISRFHMNRLKNYFNDKRLNIIFDIGAHNGDFVDNFFLKHPYSKFYCFEPLEKNYLLLKKKYSNNQNVEIYKNGIGEKNENLEINVNITTNASSFSEFNEEALFYRFRKFLLGAKKIVTHKEKCEIISLDDFVLNQQISFIDLIKIDVEGYELKVLKGAIDTLKNTKYVIIEVTLSNIFKNYNKDEIIKLLENNGFKKEKSYLFPVMNFEDRIYKNTNIT